MSTIAGICLLVFFGILLISVIIVLSFSLGF